MRDEDLKIRPVGVVESELSDVAAAPNQADEGAPGAWLVFESANEHRRLTPIPEGWEDLPPAGLGLLLGRAVPFTR